MTKEMITDQAPNSGIPAKLLSPPHATLRAMFTWLPNSTSPGSALLSQHGVIIVIAGLALAAFALMIRYSNPRDDGGYVDFTGSPDCHDGGGGDCAAD